MKKIVILLTLSILNIFIIQNIKAQSVICIGTVSSISMTDFGIEDPSFQSKWNEYLQNRTWKYASGHITFTKEFVKLYVRYYPTDAIGQEYYIVYQILKNEIDESGRKAVTLSLKSPTSTDYFPSFFLYDDKEWVLTVSGVEFVVTWIGKVL